jgi:hypothetical protein
MGVGDAFGRGTSVLGTVGTRFAAAIGSAKGGGGFKLGATNGTLCCVSTGFNIGATKEIVVFVIATSNAA